MIVTCPSCGASFKVDPARLGPAGRRVRCSSCGHRWLVRPEAPAEPPAPRPTAAAAEPARPAEASGIAAAPPGLAIVTPPRPDEDEPQAVPPPPLAGAPPLGQPVTGKGVAVAGWLVVVLILLALAGLVVGRNEIASAFPWSLAVYDRLGLAVTARLGLELKNLESRRIQDQGLTVFVVEGEVHNLASVERPVPPIRVALLDAERNELDWALFKAEASTLAAGAVTRFEARLVDPPVAAKTFRVSFAQDG